MKKTLTIRTISFKNQLYKNREKSPLHATCRLLSRAETVTTQRQSIGSKLTKGISEKHYQKQLSLKTTQRVSFKQNSQPDNDKSYKKNGKTRYEKNAHFQQELVNHCQMSSHHFRKAISLTEPSKKNIAQSRQSCEYTEMNKPRIKSQPNNPNDIKKQMMNRVAKKIEFMRKMTMQDEKETIQPINFAKRTSKEPDSAKLFNFDKIYDHCLRNINKDISRYEKDVQKAKDKKYYQLKFQSDLLTKELLQIRKSMTHKVQDVQNQSNMGIVGNFVDLAQNREKSGLKMGKKKLSAVCCNKRRSTKKNGQTLNPFSIDTRGWQVGKQEQLYICQ